MSIQKRTWLRLATVAAVALVLGPAAAWADNVIADGDGAAPVATEGNALSFGNVCAGSTVSKPVLIGIKRNGKTTSPEVFANNAAVTVSVTSVSGAGINTTPAAGGAVGSITLPPNWDVQSNNTVSGGTVTLTVHLNVASAGAVSGTVDLLASAINPNVTRPTSLTVLANVVNCDTTPPALNLPASITAEATSSAGAVVPYVATATDANPANPTVTCNPPSDSLFPIATTTVHCQATDAAGNNAFGQFTVTVVDTTAPVIAGTPDITAIEATSGGVATVTYTTPTANDVVDGAIDPACTPASGSTFALGTTTVTCTATDSHGNKGTATFHVIVRDTTAPVLMLPANVVEEATGPSGAAVSYIATAEDIADSAVTPVCTPASDSTFPVATTTVTCTATDDSGNSVTGSFNVTVEDTMPPTIAGIPTDVPRVEATGPGGAIATYSSPTATDIVDPTVPVNCTPASGSTFPIGTNIVNCTATDDAGNTATESFTVTVVDTTKPHLTLPADMVLAATDVNGAVATFTATATDIVDGNVPVSCVPASGSTFPFGITTVTCSATDNAGNKNQGDFKITVHRTMRGFYQPVDMNRVINTVKGGSTVPIKFEVFAGSVELTSTSIILPILMAKTNCDGTAAEDAIETTATGNTSLRYDTTAGQFVYNWQTPKLKGNCYQVTVSTTDGAYLTAQFKLT
ncbi:MAG TPA: HYR domain-containing protein [Micromonosporaceae bacterium]|nr:HYR domain-containing protein [Micromonosporaceae bacterium]